ncbi:MAG: DinB family protein [Thermoanaerobaculales bacterium]
MDNREFYLERVKAEGPAFSRVLRALPAAKRDYRPHERSRSAAEIAWLIATEAQTCLELIEKGKVEWSDPDGKGSLKAAADQLDRGQEKLVAALGKVDAAAWNRKAQFLMGGKVAWAAPLGQMLWGMLFDAIHHRGQLSAYIRPMGGKVPSIYGPSADDPGA